MSRYLLVFILVIFLVKCKDPIDIGSQSSKEILVVEGMFTTESRVHEVKLSLTSTYSSDPNELPVRVPATGAIVSILSDNQEVISLEEVQDGIYEVSDGFCAAVGRAYKLNIVWNGTEIESQWELVRPVSVIDTLYYRFDSKDKMIDVKIDFEDPEGINNFYRWDYEIFELFYTDLDIDTDCCALCYANYNGRNWNILNDQLIDGGDILARTVARIPLNNWTDFLVIVRQNSISPQAFSYFSQLDIQQSSGGSMFDPPPARLVGNMSYIDGTNEVVLGYFSVSDVSKDFAQISRFKYVSGLSPTLRQGDCRQINGADTLRPLLWNIKKLP